jgi:hypothetical protein
VGERRVKMKPKIVLRGALIFFAIAFLIASVGSLKAQDVELTPNEQLGKSIFYFLTKIFQ